MVGGAEALALATVVVLAGMILILNAWAVVENRMAIEGASREYLRAYTEADDPATAATDARRAATAVLADRPALLERLVIDPPPPELFGPCAPAGVTLSARVPSIHIPAIGTQWGEHTVSVSAVELIDAHQEMTSGHAYDRTRTACGG